MPEQINPDSSKYSSEFLSRIWNFFYNLLDLKNGLDKEGTIINIKSNKEMKGANAWLLMCSIFIASLGLDLNSPAVIIGAMLISPLMSPILGIGLGIGINDRNTLNVSGYHLLIAIGIALVTSTLYFSITAITASPALVKRSPVNHFSSSISVLSIFSNGSLPVSGTIE